MTLQAIVEEASKLSLAEREELIERLICMSDKDGVALTPEQAEDLDRRIDEYEAGKVKMIPGKKAFEMLRKREI
jgi:putative addiction module component (TIGR02574 family)